MDLVDSFQKIIPQKLNHYGFDISELDVHFLDMPRDGNADSARCSEKLQPIFCSTFWAFWRNDVDSFFCHLASHKRNFLRS